MSEVKGERKGGKQEKVEGGEVDRQWKLGTKVPDDFDLYFL